MIVKEIYEAPAVKVLELKAMGVICQSVILNVTYEEEDL